jgi:hypothetical protein
MDRYEALRAELAHCISQILKMDEAEFVVAPCRIQGMHWYTNAALVKKGSEQKLLDQCPKGFIAQAERGFVNYRLTQAALKEEMATLAQCLPRTVVLSSDVLRRSFQQRLMALCALRLSETAWGEEAEELAWSILRFFPGSAWRDERIIAEKFEAYFRQGAVDHDICRALLVRLLQLDTYN